MYIVYKYPISIDDYQEIKLPKDYEILCVQVQNNEPFIWVKVNPINSLEIVNFRLSGTGHIIKEQNTKYIGTFQIGLTLVFHLFKIENNENIYNN